METNPLSDMVFKTDCKSSNGNKVSVCLTNLYGWRLKGLMEIHHCYLKYKHASLLDSHAKPNALISRFYQCSIWNL